MVMISREKMVLIIALDMFVLQNQINLTSKNAGKNLKN